MGAATLPGEPLLLPLTPPAGQLAGGKGFPPSILFENYPKCELGALWGAGLTLSAKGHLSRFPSGFPSRRSFFASKRYKSEHLSPKGLFRPSFGGLYQGLDTCVEPGWGDPRPSQRYVGFCSLTQGERGSHQAPTGPADVARRAVPILGPSGSLWGFRGPNLNPFESPMGPENRLLGAYVLGYRNGRAYGSIHSENSPGNSASGNIYCSPSTRASHSVLFKTNKPKNSLETRSIFCAHFRDEEAECRDGLAHCFRVPRAGSGRAGNRSVVPLKRPRSPSSSCTSLGKVGGFRRCPRALAARRRLAT